MIQTIEIIKSLTFDQFLENILEIPASDMTTDNYAIFIWFYARIFIILIVYQNLTFHPSWNNSASKIAQVRIIII